MKKPRSRWTLRKAVREATDAGKQAYLARHGKPDVGLMVHHVSLLEEFREQLTTETREGAREIIQRAIVSAQDELCVHFINALRKRDAATLRELADYFEKPRPPVSDPIREKLAVLKLKRERSKASNGNKWYMRSVSEVADAVGYRGPLRSFRRLLGEMNFPVLFGESSQVADGDRKRQAKAVRVAAAPRRTRKTEKRR